MEIQTRTDTGRARNRNEDSVGVWREQDGAVIVLADGLGGHNAGEVASNMVVESVLTYIADHIYDSIPRDELMRNAASYANDLVYQAAGSDSTRTGMGSTVVVAILEPDTIHLAHAGDSRAYFIGPDGVVQLTIDHCVSNEYAQQGKVVSESIRHMLTRAMGTEQTIAVDYQKVRLSSDTYLLLCSDGLYNEVSPQEIEEIVLSSVSLSEKADLLIERANENGGKDNITVALIERKGASV